jgi:16S rRNA (cytosine1402-N4)-methyltransferase
LPFSQSDSGHTTVLLEEAVAALTLRPGGTYVDGTFGGGGHSRRILDDPAGIGHLVVFDADPAAIERAGNLRATLENPARLAIVHAPFETMAVALAAQGIATVDGVLLDLGVSSFQLDEADRGFAFRFQDAPLDMRFDPGSGESARELLERIDVDDLTRIVRTYGEEPRARQIAQAIVRHREQSPITSAEDLVRIVTGVLGAPRKRGIHPATRTFQALRIAVNREIDQLESVLEQSVQVIRPGGRLVVLSFHSLEDRPVKRFIERASASCICPPEQPICTCDHLATFRRIGKPVRASEAEIARNPRSRSVTMRIAERIPVDEAIQTKRTLVRTRD